jgi:hypothetical protein
MSGDIALTWVRRTRVGGDSWEPPVTPLAEAFERYEIDILDSEGSAVRTLTSDIPAATYSAAEQIADFGGVQTQVSVRIAQLSAVFGRGAAAAATV